MGLPRSSLVKSKTPDAALVQPAVAPLTPALVDRPVDPAVADAREAFRTKSDSIEVMVDSLRGNEPKGGGEEPHRGPYASSPSANDLLARAAALGPARMTWESIVLTSDPILDEKRQPHVAERRARLTRVVKLALGTCLAVCLVAVGVSAVSGDSTSSTASSTRGPSLAKTVASKGIVPIEPLEGTKHGKAARRPTPATVATVAAVRPKRR